MASRTQKQAPVCGGCEQRIKDLAAEKAAFEGACREEGEAAGREWAAKSASFAEMRRLEGVAKMLGDEFEAHYRDSESPAVEFFCDCNPGPTEIGGFWAGILGERDAYKADDAEFIVGFASGVLDAFGELSGKL